MDHSTYARNKFEDVDGKCIDLDGFHDGSIIENQCINRRSPLLYPFGHFGIVMNNTDPNMRSENVEIRGNIIDGTKFGGLFLMGRGHRVVDNSFLHLNKAECNETKQFVCIYKADEPEMLETGIYLSRGVVRMEDVTRQRDPGKHHHRAQDEVALHRGGAGSKAQPRIRWRRTSARTLRWSRSIRFVPRK